MRAVRWLFAVAALLAVTVIFSPLSAQNPFTLYQFGANVDTNAGSATANTLRTSAANLPTTVTTNAGASDASTLRVALGSGSQVVGAVTQSGNWTARVVGNGGGVLDAAGQNATQPANWLAVGCGFNTSPTTISSGSGSGMQCDNAGNLLVNIKAGGSTTVTDAATITAAQSAVALVDAPLFGYNGSAYTRLYADPCQANAKTAVSVNQTSTTQILGLSGSSKKYYVCSLNLVTATAQNIAVIDSTTASNACATSPSGSDGFGGSTAGTGWNLAANGGIALGAGGYYVGSTHNTNAALCIAQSGSGQVSGGFTYVAQ